MTTFQGLARFDGVRFTVFTTRDSPGLPSNRLDRPVMDPDGGIWLHTEQRHLVRLKGGAFTEFDASRGIPDRSTNLVYVDMRGGVWAGTQTGVFRLVDEHYRTVTEQLGATFEPSDGLLRLLTQGAPYVDSAKAIVFAGMRVARFPDHPRSYEALGDFWAAAGDVLRRANITSGRSHGDGYPARINRKIGRLAR